MKANVGDWIRFKSGHGVCPLVVGVVQYVRQRTTYPWKGEEYVTDAGTVVDEGVLEVRAAASPEAEEPK